jgi:hypothetical protein
MRREPTIIAAAVLTAVASAAIVSAQTAPGAQAKPATRQFAPELSEKPYSRLFDRQQLPDVERKLSETAAALRLKMRPNSARRFICGIGVLPADPAVDAGFARAPADTATHFTMRIVPVPCR